MGSVRVIRPRSCRRVRIHVVGPPKRVGLGESVTFVSYSVVVGLANLTAAYSELETVLHQTGTYVDFVTAGGKNSAVEQRFYDQVSFELACQRVDEVLTKYKYDPES